MESLCNVLGHDWDGCTCKRCEAEQHEWENIGTSYGMYYGTIINYRCTKCGATYNDDDRE